MADNRRRLAADARRMATKEGGDRAAAAEIRALLKRNYERGVEDGREQAEQEAAAANPRVLLLETTADMLDQALGRVSSLPNSDKAQMAFREASAILRDAATNGEDPSPPDEDEEKVTDREPSKSKTSAKKTKAKAKANA